ncbi:hypothetical protein [Anthocerotibacter panamensis]|uniref:hypothetical protein n=1 Tax=Anthocerotibacter panamensis TaxID=2857077 RepID=UPI001C4023A7|nr:hypothetical protein [Anthocerotibacter panamensis]
MTLAIVVSVLGAYAGYGFGERSLLDVSVPTSVDLKNELDTPDKAQGFIQEDQVLSQIQQSEKRLREQGLALAPPIGDPQTQAEANLDKSDIFAEPEVVAAEDKGYTTQTTNSNAVSLQVNDVRRVANSLVLEVALTNQGSEDLRFLYGDAFNLLVISDERGKRLSALTTGLPGDLPPNGEQYTGSIEVPLDELGDARYLRLSLQDYPDGKVTLVIPSLKVSG